MASATVTSKGQVTIPGSIRRLLGINSRDKLLFIPDGDGAIIKPLKRNILDIRGVAKQRGVEIDFKKLREETKKRVAKRIVEKMK